MSAPKFSRVDIGSGINLVGVAHAHPNSVLCSQAPSNPTKTHHESFKQESFQDQDQEQQHA